MLDKSLHKHLDIIDEIEADIDKEITKIYKALDIDDIINDPEGEMLATARAVRDTIHEKFADRAVEAGLDLAKVIQDHIKKNKDFKISNSKDPKLNEDLLDDKSNDKKQD